MLCPYCGSDQDRVIDSRSTEEGAVIRRRRECEACEKRFTTYERVEKTNRLVVVKKDGSRAPFDQENVLSGIQAACGKRPIPEDEKARLVREIEEELQRGTEREIPSSSIGLLVADKLKQLDEIAYIRYASEYYNFTTIEDLQEEVQNLKSRPRTLRNQGNLFNE